MGTNRQLRYLKVVFVLLLAAVVLFLLLDSHQNRQFSGIDLSRIPNVIEAWTAQDMPKSDEDQKRAEAGDMVVRSYTLEDHRIYLVAIQERGDRHRVHSPMNCYTGSGWDLMEKQDTALPCGLRVRRLLVKKDNAYRLVYYWFTNGSAYSTSFLKHLLLYAKDTMIGQNDVAWVYFDVSADITDSIEKTEIRMSDFINGMDHRQLFDNIFVQDAPS